MAFQLLTTTTTVWIIDTLFQSVSSGIKNIFYKSSYELLIAGLLRLLRFRDQDLCV